MITVSILQDSYCFYTWIDCSFSIFKVIIFPFFKLSFVLDGLQYNFTAWQVIVLFFLNLIIEDFI